MLGKLAVAPTMTKGISNSTVAAKKVAALFIIHQTGRRSNMLGDTLVAKGIITADQLKQALDEQSKSGAKLGEVLVKMGATTADKIEAALK